MHRAADVSKFNERRSIRKFAVGNYDRRTSRLVIAKFDLPIIVIIIVTEI